MSGATAPDLAQVRETLEYLRAEARKGVEISVWLVQDLCDQALAALGEETQATDYSYTRRPGERQLPSITARQSISRGYPHRRADNCPCMKCWPPKKWPQS